MNLTRPIILALLGSCMAMADTPAPQVSVVGENAMPKDIVTPPAKWNFGPGSLWTHKGWQYAAYWDDQCQVSVARRQLPSGNWSVVSLSGYRRTATENRGKVGPKAMGFGDGHEKVAMGISDDGVIHLAFDHHGSTLRYRASELGLANDPEAHEWSAERFGPVQDNLGGSLLDYVTYPSFTVDGNRLALYLRMGGGSGSGNSHFCEYENGSWIVNEETASKLIDKNWSGGNGTVNAYPFGTVVQNGRRHLAWCWRDSPAANSCHDLCYAYSDDHGQTWKNNDGETIAQLGSNFITADSPGVAVWEIPPGTKYINGGSMQVDSTGRVHVLVRGEDGTPAYFTRNPTTGKWNRTPFPMSGKLIANAANELFVVSEDGIQRILSAQTLEPVSSGQPDLFKDSKMSIDRIRNDGWLSVIGQQDKTVTVIDYWIGK